MSYLHNRILKLVDAYADMVGFHVSNLVTHIVTEDYNLEDHNIEFALKWIEEHRAEWGDPNSEFYVSERDIQISIAFLNLLKAMPEDWRTAHWDEDDEPQPSVVEMPLKSEAWLSRHGG